MPKLFSSDHIIKTLEREGFQFVSQPGDVLHDGELELRAAGPDAVSVDDRSPLSPDRSSTHGGAR